MGDMLLLHKDERIPADVILLRTTEKQGTCFIRTDQLDGETDWKMRVAVAPTQHLEQDDVSCSAFSYSTHNPPTGLLSNAKKYMLMFWSRNRYDEDEFLFLQELFDQNAELYIEKPQCDIHAFLGTFKRTTTDGVDQFPLNGLISSFDILSHPGPGLPS